MMMTYNDLGTAVNQAFLALEKDGISPTFFGKHLAVPMGLSDTSIAEYIRGYKGGSIYGSSSGNPTNKKGRLEKTAIFLYPLNFSEKYPEVLVGIRERDERFVYPPPEEKRVSYEEIIEGYRKTITIKENASGEELKERILDENIGSKVMRLLALPVTDKPDSVVGWRDWVKRIVTLEGCKGYERSHGYGIEINIMPQDGIPSDFHILTFNAFYLGGSGTEGQGKKLIEFLGPPEGKEAYIVYNRKSSYGRPLTVLQMIAPLEEYQLYVRGLKGKEGLVLYKLDFKVKDYPLQMMTSLPSR